MNGTGRERKGRTGQDYLDLNNERSIRCNKTRNYKKGNSSNMKRIILMA